MKRIHAITRLAVIISIMAAALTCAASGCKDQDTNLQADSKTIRTQSIHESRRIIADVALTADQDTTSLETSMKMDYVTMANIQDTILENCRLRDMILEKNREFISLIEKDTPHLMDIRKETEVWFAQIGTNQKLINDLLADSPHDPASAPRTSRTTEI